MIYDSHCHLDLMDNMTSIVQSLAKEDTGILLKEFRNFLSKDPIPTTLVDMTMLGLVEITRKKVRKPLYEQAGQTYDGMRGDKNL